jgi:hypothetical protein
MRTTHGAEPANVAASVFAERQNKPIRDNINDFNEAYTGANAAGRPGILAERTQRQQRPSRRRLRPPNRACKSVVVYKQRT